MGRRRKDTIPVLSDEDSSESRPPVQRNCANARERDRMRVLSKAFSRLKTTLPWVPPDTKLSKLDTLRLATCYIAHLRQILAEDEDDVLTTVATPRKTCGHLTQSSMEGGNIDPQSFHLNNKICNAPPAMVSRNNDVKGSHASESGYVHPLNLTWPFNFTGRYSVSVPQGENRIPTLHTALTSLNETSDTRNAPPVVAKHEIHTS